MGQTRILSWEHLQLLLSVPPQRLNPFAASKAALHLGGLARWCLRADVLRLAAEVGGIPGDVRDSWCRAPLLTPNHGSCWVVFAAKGDCHFSLLRSAFVLPVRWIRAAHHSAFLPPSLIELADSVIEDLAPKSEGWTLQWAPGLETIDAREIPLECESGWASLATGLLLAIEGGTVRTDVWASGCWDRSGGIQPVDRLEEKLELAREYNVSLFLVPESQMDSARKLVEGSEIQIGRLASCRSNPRDTLSDYLWNLEAPPVLSEDPGSYERCKSYYLRMPSQRKAECEVFYRENLLPVIARDLRTPGAFTDPVWAPSHLVTIVSDSPNLIRLAVRVLGVKSCLLLYTSHRMAEVAEVIRGELATQAIVCQLGEFDVDGDLMGTIGRCVSGFVEGVPEEQVVFDLTPGSKLMTLALARMAQSRNWLMYLSHGVAADRRPIPGTERLIRWQPGEAWFPKRGDRS